MGMGKTLFLLDGMALLYRAHFAFVTNPIRNSKGLNTSALHGFLNVVLELKASYPLTHMAVALDTSAPTIRHRLYPAYKAQREAMPEELAACLPWFHELCEAMNLPVIKQDGYEADDIIGTLARRAESEGFTTYMVTPDKDFSQLVTDHIFLLKPGRKGGPAECEGIIETCRRWEIDQPSQVIDILGLWGDASDNIPGVPGVGQKTAIKLISQYGSMEAILEEASEIKGKLGERLREHAQQAILSKQLATIDVEVPLGLDLVSLELQEPDRNKLDALLGQLEFRSHAKRLLGSSAASKDGIQATKQEGSEDQQLELLVQAQGYEASTGSDEAHPAKQTLQDYPHRFLCLIEEEELKKWIAQCREHPFIALDCETSDLDPKQAQLLGLSLAYEAGSACYIPLNDDQPIPLQRVREMLEPLLCDPNIGKVGHNIKYDISVLAWQGWEVRGPLWDTMVANRLMHQDQRHGLDALARSLLDYEPISIETLIGPKGKDQRSMGEVDLDTLAEYAAEDAEVTWRLRQVLQDRLSQSGQERVFHEIEMPLIYVLISMERQGVKLDTDALEQFSKQLLEQTNKLQERIHALAGVEFNIASPKQLGEILFERLKLVDKPKKTRTGQYATHEAVLQSLAAEHEIVQTILDYRMVTKLRNTYAEALPQSIFEKTGRVHTTFHQVATATGRLNSQNPNLQNIPIRRDLGQEIRKAFVPCRAGQHLLSADYSQIELRIMASMSGDPAMKAAFAAGEDIHAATAAHVFQVPSKEVTQEMRRQAKMVNFGVLYGISAFGLAQRLGISRTEAAAIIEHYWKNFPSIKAYIDQTLEQARANGYVATLLGRRRYLPDIQSANGTIRGMAERNAINTPIQGTAADMIKLAMIGIGREMAAGGFRSQLILQVHDELVFDVLDEELDELKELVGKQMRHALPMEVAMEVEMGVGEHWLAAH
jgi:DNA polymerase-1